MKWSNKGHEYDHMGDLLKSKKKIVIYGAGILGLELEKLITSLNKDLGWNICFVDRYKGKIDGSMLDEESNLVFFPSELKYFNVEESFVVVCAFSEEAQEEMVSNCEQAGFTLNKNIFSHDFFLYNMLSIHFVYQLDKVYISSTNIVPSTICNLNCFGCLNFNPYINNHTVHTIDSLMESCDSFFNSIDLVGRFQITGGEPFLYKDLMELIEYINNNYREKIIYFEIVTNGKNIPSNELCALFNKSNMLVYLDDYRESVPELSDNFLKIKEKFEEYGVLYIENYTSQWFDLDPTQEVNEGPEEEIIAHFDQCGCPWSTLEDSKISSCNYSLYATKAGLVKYDENNYYDLKQFTPEKKKELVEFRLRFSTKGFVELCRQCSGFSKINTNIIEPAVQVKR